MAKIIAVFTRGPEEKPPGRRIEVRTRRHDRGAAAEVNIRTRWRNPKAARLW